MSKPENAEGEAFAKREARVIAHAFHLYSKESRKIYKRMNEYCMKFGHPSRSSDQFKYKLKADQVVRDAVDAFELKEDVWDEALECKLEQERLASCQPVPAVNLVAGKSTVTPLSPDLQHRKLVREKFDEQNSFLGRIAHALERCIAGCF
jgi:hypothetical protein